MHRRWPIFMLTTLVLLVAVSASIVALFVRGFQFQDLTTITKRHDEVTTPTMQVWLTQTDGYTDKMDAYKAGIAASTSGSGVYLRAQENSWSLCTGVYLTAEMATQALTNTNLPNHTQAISYQINSKTFTLEPAITPTCQSVLETIQSVFSSLMQLRDLIVMAQDTANLTVEITTLYNQLKNDVTTLQTANTNYQNPFIATLIYSANQNILNLYEVIFNDTNDLTRLAAVNTALLNCIFSLDNF